MRPKLRAMETQMIQQAGQPALLLRDPLRLSGKVVVIAAHLAPLLALCDGTRDEASLRIGFQLRTGLPLSPSTLEQLLMELDEALLLDNERAAAAQEAALAEYRTRPFRRPALAGDSYPLDPSELRKALDAYAHPFQAKGGAAKPSGRIRGLLCPHIDLARGGSTYASVWLAAAEAVQAAQLVIIFGTDHTASQPTITLTRQHYATPWGVLPTALPVVEVVAEALGREQAFASELHHRHEHSIEVAALWLHYLLEGQPREIVPILCGSFQPLMDGGQRAADQEYFGRALEALRAATGKRRTLVVAAADLAHLGPAFGDPQPVSVVEKARLSASDAQLLHIICSGQAEAFFQSLQSIQNRQRVCGLPPIYLALRFLEDVQGTVTDYRQCPADAAGTSLVSIAGVLFR